MNPLFIGVTLRSASEDAAFPKPPKGADLPRFLYAVIKGKGHLSPYGGGNGGRGYKKKHCQGLISHV
ncbi:MAG: hypothetical protein C4576_02520 [Desulfobacteraceae bacterium]|nr:MAG: hypothetical protein C4576_02520 [Desulfobacteraceae bacterium]